MSSVCHFQKIVMLISFVLQMSSYFLDQSHASKEKHVKKSFVCVVTQFEARSRQSLPELIQPLDWVDLAAVLPIEVATQPIRSHLLNKRPVQETSDKLVSLNPLKANK